MKKSFNDCPLCGGLIDTTSVGAYDLMCHSCREYAIWINYNKDGTSQIDSERFLDFNTSKLLCVRRHNITVFFYYAQAYRDI